MGDYPSLQRYVEEDLGLIVRFTPYVVVGDFRLSLSVNARLRKLPYITICDAYWSPELPIDPPLPVLPFTRFVPLSLATPAFRLATRFAFPYHAHAMERLRAHFGLPGLGHDLRRVYTDADRRLFANIPALFPDVRESREASFLGPIAWSPPPVEGMDLAALPRPLVFVTMGSSGDASVLGGVVRALAPVAGSLVVRKYPFPGRSYLLRNDKGKFVDVTKEWSDKLQDVGMGTDAEWTDINKDGKFDLMVVGEWMNISVFVHDGSKLVDQTAKFKLDNTRGWCNRIVGADVDNDGDTDFIVGNLGLNYKYRIKAHKPFQVYARDFDKNGKSDIILGQYKSDGKLFPVRGRQCSSEQMPRILDKFKTFDEFGKSTMEEVYGELLNGALHYKADLFESVILLNNGGNFEIQKLPNRAQISPVNGIVFSDFDGDQNGDILLAGNSFVSEVETGNADAGVGLFMKGDGKGGFIVESPEKSGFCAIGDVKNMLLLKRTYIGKPCIIIANNNQPAQIFVVGNEK